ncbi:MAG: Arc family DNA-binding protein [Bryobacteraceae bacterium]
MAERKSFLLRIDERVLDEVRRWADDELRSLNGQIEFILREALRARGRLPARDEDSDRPSGK